MSAPVLPASVRAQEELDPPWVILAGQGSGPLGRWRHSLIFDTSSNRLFVIGGEDANGIVRGDVWSFDLPSYTWTELDLNGPTARSGSAVATATDGSGFYYFGGESNDTTFDDLWRFDFASTAWRLIDASPGPPARTDTRGAIDAYGRFVVTHGRNGNNLFDDTWAFDPATETWTELASLSPLLPMARFDHDFVSLPDSGILLLTCGSSEGIGPIRHGDLWTYDIYNDLWTEITPAVGPAPRTGAAMSRLGSAVLLIGGDAELGLQSDVWAGNFFDGFFAWTEFTPVNHGPLGIYRRAWHDMTAANGEFYLFGGFGVEGALSDLWKFSPERVSQPRDDSDYIEPTS